MITAPTPTRGDSGYSRFISRLLRSHLILLDLAVRHDPFPNLDSLLRKMHFELAERHSSAILFGGLRKFLWRTQRLQTAGEIFERLLGEVTIAVVSEQGAIDQIGRAHA